MTNDDPEFWLAASTGCTSKHRVLHHSRDCKSLNRSNPRPATEREHRVLEECQHCTGTREQPSNPDMSYYQALRSAANGGDD